MVHNPRLLALATAVPPHVFNQRDVMEAVHIEWIGPGENMERLLPVFDNAGIDTRHSCIPMDWLREDRNWPDRSAAYVEGAVELLERTALDCLAQAGLAVDEIDAIVTVSTTGVTTPSLDALLVERLGMRRNITRLPIFGLGCAGGVLGLGRAAALAQAMPGARVLLLVVELCVLTFRKGDKSKSNIIATALFGDGAAGAILNCAGEGPSLVSWGEHTWPGSLDVMGWRIEPDGFGVLFSRDIPELIRTQFRPALDGYLTDAAHALADYDAFVCHPGGTKVVAALEETLELQTGSMTHARTVLRDYGNMSAATVFFVLERTLEAGSRGRHLLSALGPGFSAGFLTMDVP
ncbi:MAG: type III polyketide synthase [Alphaproteobacteria bacterium]|nr:type III polyketide synthase [Alphaproteobacteria bacterium]